MSAPHASPVQFAPVRFDVRYGAGCPNFGSSLDQEMHTHTHTHTHLRSRFKPILVFRAVWPKPWQVSLFVALGRCELTTVVVEPVLRKLRSPQLTCVFCGSGHQYYLARNLDVRLLMQPFSDKCLLQQIRLLCFNWWSYEFKHEIFKFLLMKPVIKVNC